MKNYETLEIYKRCLLEDPDNCLDKECALCDYWVDDDVIIEAISKGIKLLKLADC